MHTFTKYTHISMNITHHQKYVIMVYPITRVPYFGPYFSRITQEITGKILEIIGFYLTEYLKLVDTYGLITPHKISLFLHFEEIYRNIGHHIYSSYICAIYYYTFSKKKKNFFYCENFFLCLFKNKKHNQ